MALDVLISCFWTSLQANVYFSGGTIHYEVVHRATLLGSGECEMSLACIVLRAVHGQADKLAPSSLVLSGAPVKPAPKIL